MRELFSANAGYRLDEFHCDGLLLDATQNIYDESLDHILAAVTRHVMDHADGLLRQGAEGCQLTWMDAKVDG